MHYLSWSTFFQHCDKVMVKGYSGVLEKDEGKTVYSAVCVISESVHLVKSRSAIATWKITMDKLAVSV